MNGRLMSVDWAELSSRFAFSHASCSRCNANRVLAKVDPLFLLELVGDVVDEDLVEIVAAEVAVTVRADHAEDAFGDLQDGNVERSTAQVEDDDLLVLVLAQAVGQRRGGRLVDDPRDLHPGNLAGILRRLALGVVEVGRHGK